MAMTGILGTKLGMTQVFDETGQVVPVTVVQAGPCVVTAVRTPDNDGYSAVQIGFGEINPRKVTKPVAGLFEKAGVTPRRYVAEIRTEGASEYTLGQEITATLFEAGQRVDVTGKSKGKGTAGVMKRHGFKGLSASHGTQRKHRSPGSIGACATPGPRLQGRADGGPDGRGADDRAEPDRARRGQRQEPAADQGRGSRPARRACRGALRGTRGELMSTVNVVSPSSEEAGTVELPDAIFAAKVNVPLMHQVVVAQRAAARQGTHATKTRGMVSGGGRKPYRQKGTGRARQGSTRAPQFTGGGVAHGPVPRDYTQKTPKKMKAAALRGALSDRAASERVFVVTSFVEGDVPRTKDALAVLDKVTDGAVRNVLVVTEHDDELSWKSLRNVPFVHLLAEDQLNTYDVLASDYVVFTKAALDAFVERGSE